MAVILSWSVPRFVCGQEPKPDSEVKFTMLPDRGYTFEQVRTDHNLVFITPDSLRPAQASRYWLKFTARNESNYSKAYRLKVLPKLDNSFFYFNPDAGEWVSQRAGIYVATDNNRTRGKFSVVLPGKSVSTFFLQLNFVGDGALPVAVKPTVLWEKESEARDTDNFFSTAWMVSMALLAILFLNNLYLYYRFGDQTVVYFLVVQAGGMLYITTYRFFLNIIFPSPIFNLHLKPEGRAYAYDMNQVFMHLSVALILYGGVQVCRSYLQTKVNLPTLDKWLRISLYSYLVFTAVVMLVNVTMFCINPYTLPYDNMLVLVVAGLLLLTGTVAYRKKVPFARAYLYANVLPVVFIFSVAFYHVFIGMDNPGKLLLPDLAIISLGLCFSIIIVSRMRTLEESLVTKEEEARHLAREIRQREQLHRQLTRENNQIQADLRETQGQRNVKELENRQLSVHIQEEQTANKDLQEKLAGNHRELASITLYMEQKNAMLAKLKLQIEELNKLNPNNKHLGLSEVKSLLQSNLHLDDDWSKFKLHFEQVHPNFFQELQARYPTLTKNELRLYSYFHINLATKEIAALLNIEPASVRRAKTRLFKKIADTEQGLNFDDPEANVPFPSV